MHPGWTVNAVRRRFAQLLPRLREPPVRVKWWKVRPKPAEPLMAELACTSGSVRTPRGTRHYQAGKHYLVRLGPGERLPMRRSLFERLYQRRPDGKYENRLDVLLRFFTLAYPVLVETLDGLELAHAGDWIMQGCAEDLWPISAQDGAQMYELVQ